MSSRRFRKYGQHFDRKPETPSADPESPYEELAYKAPDKRPLTAVEREQAELEELRDWK